MERSRAHAQLLHRGSHQGFAGLVEDAELTDVSRSHIGVAPQAGAFDEALSLLLPRRDHSRANSLAGFTQAIARQLFKIDARHFDVNIKAIE
jgi:hypothetical protein